jgi:hypothetical protein
MLSLAMDAFGFLRSWGGIQARMYKINIFPLFQIICIILFLLSHLGVLLM